MNKATNRKMKALDNLEDRIKVELKEEIAQHIKWNENHTKRIVELTEENNKIKKEIKYFCTERCLVYDCADCKLYKFANVESEVK